MIESGASIPAVNVKLVQNGEIIDTNTSELFAKGISVLFCVPGAFTPTCSNNHLPGYVRLAGELRNAGADQIICAAANDHHVLKAWSDTQSATGKIGFIADIKAEFAAGLGVAVEMAGLGMRYMRSAFLIRDGKIVSAYAANQAGQLGDTSAESVLAALRSQSVSSH
ncbi:MAG: peroxiredoxin [Hyphomicrobiaceae bacterium]|nr:peroxiredoxin [Hyphomicrobiaceae bacterium]MCC0023037.1 peroxiredoxin [Hyphomicrobiaceae bacterium]